MSHSLPWSASPQILFYLIYTLFHFSQMNNGDDYLHMKCLKHFCAYSRPTNLPLTKNTGHCSYILQDSITSHSAAIPLFLSLICRGNEAQSPAEELRAAQGTLQCKCQVITRKLGEWKHTG